MGRKQVGGEMSINIAYHFQLRDNLFTKNN